MSKESRQRLRDQAKGQDKSLSRRKMLRWVLPLVAVIVLAAGFAAWKQVGTRPSKASGLVARMPAPFKQPRTLKELLALSTEQLERCDVGLMNLLCAEGLPGAQQLDVQDGLKILDGFAETVRFETQRHAYRFNEHPDQFRQSLGYYRMMMLGTVLAQDVGIRYNPKLALPQLDGKIPTLGESANSEDVFIHGLLRTNSVGTCASMPVLVAAVARRLGYPVNLAGAKYHLYVRYEEPNGKHFNVEPTVTEAFLTPEDEEYKSGQFKTTAEEIKGYTWLQPLSNKQVLAHFLNTRAICLGDAKRYDEAKQTLLLSASFWQETPQRKKSTDYYLQALKDAPTGDRWESLWEEIEKLQVPEGPRSAYFDNRKAQVHYFMNDNSDWPAIESAAKDLKQELAEYERQLSAGDPALAQYRQHILALNLKSGKVRLPAEVLPPPLNRDSIPPDYFARASQTESGDPDAIIDALWGHYKRETLGWMGQSSLLPSW